MRPAVNRRWEINRFETASSTGRKSAGFGAIGWTDLQARQADAGLPSHEKRFGTLHAARADEQRTERRILSNAGPVSINRRSFAGEFPIG
ncbi:MAG: hypothetical protein Fues2KO_20420 [Fuerstiella sp.]